MIKALSSKIDLLESLSNEAHVWFCYPDEIKDESLLQEYFSCLSTEEKEQQQRFHFDRDKHLYLVSHALVRKVLSKYCDIEPEQWSFTANDHGRPEVSSNITCPPIRFNLSHADGIAACVVTLSNDCGIDVENTERQNELLSLAKRMFAEPELATLLADNSVDMRRKFFEFWTLREAYVKALGTGLSGSSKQFYFTVTEDNKATICFENIGSTKDFGWHCELFTPQEKFQIAVVVQHDIKNPLKVISQQICP